jgi:hypothetical protein
MIAWIGAAALGLLFAYYPPIIVGPLSDLGGGMDYSLIVAVVSAAVLYLGALWLWPEPRGVFGEDGPRGVASSDTPLQEVVIDHSSTAAKVYAKAQARETANVDA